MNKTNLGSKTHLYVDLDTNLKESNSRLLQKLPPFITRLLKRIIHQDKINHTLNKFSENSGREFLTNIIAEFNIDIQITGKENLPDNGKCFFVANHPFGIIDGLIITSIVSEKYGALKAIANDAFQLIPQLKPFIASVDVYSSTSREYIQALNLIYESETPITHFPAGRVSRWNKGKIQDDVWQKSFISKSVNTQRNIVPIYFDGCNSRLFQLTYRFRCFLGIKTNIELMLLPHEFFNKKNNTIKVVIGSVIPYTTFTTDKKPYDWAQEVRSSVYKLNQKIL